VTAASVELVEAVSPTIESLMATHRERRAHWYAHEIIPWERGRSYADEPWDESQATLSPIARTALHINLLTEDNLPYYYAKLATSFPEDSPMTEWARLWTAEEAQHGSAMREYLLVSRNCDPVKLEDDRLETTTRGWATDVMDPVDLFVYTSAQELATRISHRNAGSLADDEAAFQLMKRIAADENHHFLFYRGVTTAMLKEAPTHVIGSIYKVLSNFEMPGTTIPGFSRKAMDMARAGVYNMRIHAEQVVQPLLREWNIGSLDGLSGAAAQAQDKIMSLYEDLLVAAEDFEARLAKRKKRLART
jgi:acyl-[acyl-carrier-protein] desaturase